MKWIEKEVINFPIEITTSYGKLAKLLKMDRAQLHRQLTGKIIMSKSAAASLVRKIEKLGLGSNKELSRRISDIDAELDKKQI